MRYVLLVLLWLLGFSSTTSGAAQLTIDSNGKLTGARGVVLSGFGVFNVKLVDGTCPEVFDGCDSSDDFLFKTADQAHAAGNALLEQVVIGAFDDSPERTSGCTDVELCGMFVPVKVKPTSDVLFAVYGVSASNLVKDAAFFPFDDYVFPTPDASLDGLTFIANSSLSTRGDPDVADYRVWTVWSVPEPGTISLLILGATVLAGSRRRGLP